MFSVAPTPSPAPSSFSFQFGAKPAEGLSSTSFTAGSAPASGFTFSSVGGVGGIPGFGSSLIGGGSKPATGFGGGGGGGGGGGDAEDGEGGEEPILPVEKAIRRDDDKEEILLETECKLQIFKAPDDAPSGPKQWKDLVNGILRITRDPDTRKQRLIVRNIVGRILFNAAIYKGMIVRKVGKKIQFLAVVDPKLWDPSSKVPVGPQMISLKVNSSKLDETAATMEACVKEAV